MSRPLEESPPYAFTVPPLDKAVPVTRNRVVERAQRLGLPMDESLIQDLKLLTTEVVTNSITHTKASCVVCVRWTGERLRVEVTDVDPTVLSLSHADPMDESGRGLFLVDSLAAAWGTEPCPAGKTTWFELAIPVPGEAPTPTALSHVQEGARHLVVSSFDGTPPVSAEPKALGCAPSRSEHQAA
jgi:anti-sigma regulatory factor (Ser/Thr protein kinase)